MARSRNSPNAKVQYVTAEEVLGAHAELIDSYGGSHGLRDLTLIESAVARPRAGYGDFEAYPTIWDKAAVLLQSIVLNHAFIDGNKRTGTIAALLFLERNGHVVTCSQHSLVAFTLKVASKQMDEAKIATWLKTHATEAA